MSISPKILYLVDSLEIGGAERSLLEITRRLNNFSPLLCYLQRGDTLRKEYEKAGIPTIPLDLSGNKAFLSGAYRLVQILQAELPDLIHSTLYQAGIISRLASWVHSVPIIHTWVNEPVAHSHPDNQTRRGRKWLAQKMDAWTSHRVTRFLANSQRIADTHHRALRIPKNRITVIYRGRHPATYSQVTKAKADRIRKELGISPEDCMILNVARLRSWKRQKDLIQALPKVLREAPCTRLIIAGEGPARTDLQAQIQALDMDGRTQLLGERDDIPTLLAAADIFAFPSSYEGHPGALVEAMFAGLPIVASNIPVHRETLENGISGLLTPVGDISSIAETLVQLNKDPEKGRQIGQAARQRANRYFHIDTIVRRHEEVYREVLCSRCKIGARRK